MQEVVNTSRYSHGYMPGLATIRYPQMLASSAGPISSKKRDEHIVIQQWNASSPGPEPPASMMEQLDKETIDVGNSAFLSQISFVDTQLHNPLSSPPAFITPCSQRWSGHWPAHHTCLYLQRLLTGSVDSQFIASVHYSSNFPQQLFPITTRNHGWLLLRTWRRPRCPL